MSKTVALCLGSGGARGYTHIGVIEALEERGYEVVAISGCSMGAIVGGFYSAGKLAEYRDWVVGLRYLDVIRLLDISLLSGGMIRGDKIFNVIDELLAGIQIEDLAIPFTAVATDLTGHKEVWFQNGPLAQAVRASAAIPGMLSPVAINGSMMVDGAVLNPLPITPCVSAHADLIIAVDLSADVPIPDLKPAPKQVKTDEALADVKIEVAEKKGPEWFNGFLDKAGGWLDGINKNGRSTPEKIKQKEQQTEQLGKIAILNRVIDVMGASLTQYKIAGYPPDLLIKIPRNSCEIYEFYRAQEMIDLGKHIADRVLDAYEKGDVSRYGEGLSYKI